MKQSILKTIKETSKTLLGLMGFEGEIRLTESGEKGILISIDIQSPQILIGQRGENLKDLEHILRLILRRKLKEATFINLDISDYKKKRGEFLKELACSIADQVSLSKKSVTLDPMSSYERRIIHLELASREDVTTESLGEEPERRMVISPYP